MRPKIFEIRVPCAELDRTTHEAFYHGLLELSVCGSAEPDRYDVYAGAYLIFYKVEEIDSEQKQYYSWSIEYPLEQFQRIVKKIEKANLLDLIQGDNSQNIKLKDPFGNFIELRVQA